MPKGGISNEKNSRDYYGFHSYIAMRTFTPNFVLVDSKPFRVTPICLSGYHKRCLRGMAIFIRTAMFLYSSAICYVQILKNYKFYTCTRAVKREKAYIRLLLSAVLGLGDVRSCRRRTWLNTSVERSEAAKKLTEIVITRLLHFCSFTFDHQSIYSSKPYRHCIVPRHRVVKSIRVQLTLRKIAVTI